MRNRHVTTYRAFMLVLLALVPNATSVAQDYEVAFPGLSFARPVDLQHSGDGTNRLFVVEQNQGLVQVFNNNPAASTKSVYLDVTDRFNAGDSEEGLLGLAFHPDFESNGFLYVYYSASNPRRSVIERFRVDSLLQESVDRATGRVILEVNQPAGNHNGGQLRFGPDGYLYIGLGDGGGSGDPEEAGQDRTKLLGSLLRIDVDQTTDLVDYGIPPDNPFVDDTTGVRHEIYAWGLRNPWRFSFDADGNLWLGDVGQSTVEEVNIIQKGGNYGWNTMEGTLCYDPRTGCDQSGLELPVHEYGRSLGQSITGGFRYRGLAVPGMQGNYVFGDFASGRVWALPYENGVAGEARELFDTTLGIAAFGEDELGELYFCAFDGRIYKFTAGTVASDPDEEVVPPSVQVYPNPASEHVTFTIAGTALSGRFRVFDTLGRLVFEEIADAKVNDISQVVWRIGEESTEVAAGVYFYSLEYGTTAGNMVVSGSFAVVR